MIRSKPQNIVFDPSKIYKAVEDIAPILAKEYAETLIKNIETNKFGNVNAPSTIKRKGSDIPMIDRGDLLKSIIVEKSIVKVRSGKHYSGLSFNELMSILEYGRLDKGILPYSVWSQTKDEFETRAKEIIKEELLKLYPKSKRK